jgi:pyruvate,water dikinase
VDEIAHRTRDEVSRSSAASSTTTEVIDLRDDAARAPELTGSKAAALATAVASGLRVLPGVVLTTDFSHAVDAGTPVAEQPATRLAFDRAGGEERALVARSSSVLEDTAGSSMAGQFDSVIGIAGYEAFVDAVQQVLDSRTRAGVPGSPIAILVQPLIDPRSGGVMFGIDPVTGRSDRRVVAAVEGGPEALVSGETDGSRAVLDAHGALVQFTAGDGPRLSPKELRALVALGDDAARVFGGPQDVEWAIEADGPPVMLQSRPVTTEVRGVPRGPIYGPGPVAETFPEPLTELENDLWLPPLREGVREAVLLAGVATQAEVDASEVVVNVAGYVAIDLRLAGVIRPKRSVLSRLNPVPSFRQARHAWRVGRLRAALPDLAEKLLDRVDDDLSDVPPLSELTDRQLVALFHRGHVVLRSLHAHEILIGLLTDIGRNPMTGASIALRVLAEARRDGSSDEEIVARSPVVLALAPPRIAPQPSLPGHLLVVDLGTADGDGNANGILREALRLRARWVQELTGRAAWELGVRLTESGDLVSPDMIRHMTLDHVEAVFTKRAILVPALVQTHLHRFGPPLPASFRLSDRGKVLAEQCEEELGGGTGAGGGEGRGPVTHDVDNPPAGSVLVVKTLTPALAPLLPRLHGIVAETGSVLSHLAILSREAGVPTVVSYVNATQILDDGTEVLVDGETGRVTIVSEEVST